MVFSTLRRRLELARRCALVAVGSGRSWVFQGQLARRPLASAGGGWRHARGAVDDPATPLGLPTLRAAGSFDSGLPARAGTARIVVGDGVSFGRITRSG